MFEKKSAKLSSEKFALKRTHTFTIIAMNFVQEQLKIKVCETKPEPQYNPIQKDLKKQEKASISPSYRFADIKNRNTNTHLRVVKKSV